MTSGERAGECSPGFRRGKIPPLPYGRLEVVAGECFQSFASVSNRGFVIRFSGGERKGGEGAVAEGGTRQRQPPSYSGHSPFADGSSPLFLQESTRRGGERVLQREACPISRTARPGSPARRLLRSGLGPDCCETCAERASISSSRQRFAHSRSGSLQEPPRPRPAEPHRVGGFSSVSLCRAARNAVLARSAGVRAQFLRGYGRASRRNRRDSSNHADSAPTSAHADTSGLPGQTVRCICTGLQNRSGVPREGAGREDAGCRRVEARGEKQPLPQGSFLGLRVATLANAAPQPFLGSADVLPKFAKLVPGHPKLLFLALG